jgi:hypothetical protein
MNVVRDEVRAHLKRERELHAYAARLAAKLEAHPSYGLWMMLRSRRGKHPCGGRFARQSGKQEMGSDVPAPG